MTKEKRTFLLKVKIEDSDGQIKELSKKQGFEIERKEEKKGRKNLPTYCKDWPSKKKMI